ncbi:MAG TPA: glycosyltransferase [Chitinispirillaceae bacterium]|nr:glycosyltransferase [Chitinispirillaceae bacterium]
MHIKIETADIQKKIQLNRLENNYPFGFNVAGYLSKDFGLGFAARNTVKLLLDNDFSVSIFDIPLQGYAGQCSPIDESLVPASDNPFPYFVTIFHVNPNQLSQFLTYYTPFSASHINLLVPFWELEQAPASWIEMCSFIDLFLAPSHFIEKGLQALFTEKKVLYYQQTCELPFEVIPDRKRFGIPEDKTVFFQSFDIASDIVRKNPIATINAFYKAFEYDTHVLLILNVNVTNCHGLFMTALSKLKGYVSTLPNVIVFDDAKNYNEVLSLCACCDILVSLHCAEGLGLSLIEAMLMGKGVITTAYSGNLDYVNIENACLAPFRRIPAVSVFNPSLSGTILGFDPFWADPDTNQAAIWMRKLHEDVPFRNSMKEKAKKSIELFLAESRKASVFFLLKELYSKV